MTSKVCDINPENIYDFGNNIDTSDLCADIEYFLILPFSCKESMNSQYMKTIPYVVTYNDDTLDMKAIIKEYAAMNPSVEQKIVQLTLRSGQPIIDQLTIRDLKLEMGGGNLNGLNLFTQLKKQVHKENDDSDQDIFQDQCCISTYLSGQDGFGTQFLILIIEIPLKNQMAEVFTISVDGNSNLTGLIKLILKELRQEFGLNLAEADISNIYNKEAEKPLNGDKVIIAQKVYNKSRLKLQLKDPSINLKRIKAKEYNSYIVIYKEGEKDPKKFKYSEISELTFTQLYTTHLELQESKKRKDVCYALKINDMIIMPNEKIKLAEIYFKHENKGPLNVVAKVVNEKMVFFHTIPSLIKEGQDFVIDKYINIPPNQEEKRKSVRQKSKMRAKDTKNQYFKREDRLEPIMIYTSELKYVETPSKQSKIYESLNRFLRENPLHTLQESQLKQQWRYLYSSALLKHLKNIKPYTGKTYRGISYDPKAAVGKIITFKQFLSTSLKRQTAINFASSNQDTIKHMFQLDIIEGYPIRQFSDFATEEEILLEPFTDFQVVKIEQKTEKINDKEHKFRIYSLKQLQTSKDLPHGKANFVVWLDDKPKEGKQIFGKIDMPLETTILVQILSTQELVKWLKKNQFLFTDPTANLIFITNMCRMQNGKLNEIAGIEGLREIRKYSPQMQIFFYIGDLGKAKKKLTDHKIDLKSVTVGNLQNQILSYVATKINEKKDE